LLTGFATETSLIRVRIEATAGTGLATTSFAILDRITTAPRSKAGPVVGRLDDTAMLAINRAMTVFLGLV